jgi:hypothetical protein
MKYYGRPGRDGVFSDKAIARKSPCSIVDLKAPVSPTGVCSYRSRNAVATLNSLTRLTGLGSVEQQFSRKPRPAGRWDRPELRRMLDQLREDDVVAVWKLDGRSAP